LFLLIVQAKGALYGDDENAPRTIYYYLLKNRLQ